MKNAIRIGIFIVVCAVLIVGYYFYLSHGRTSKDPTPIEQTELEKVLTVDFTTKYPQTPREVVKWYNRILKLYYSGDVSDTQVEMLCDQALMLFDDDLLQANPRDQYIAAVKAEVEEYATRKKKMVKADVADTNDVVYKKLNGDEMAYVLATYVVSEGSDYQTTYQKYALRKSNEGRWKIVAFELSDEDGI